MKMSLRIRSRVIGGIARRKNIPPEMGVFRMENAQYFSVDFPPKAWRRDGDRIIFKLQKYH